MAGFFGLFNYSKPGKGVRKDAPEYNGFIRFFVLYFRRIWKLIPLNLIYFVITLPLLTLLMLAIHSAVDLPLENLGFDLGVILGFFASYVPDVFLIVLLKRIKINKTFDFVCFIKSS